MIRGKAILDRIYPIESWSDLLRVCNLVWDRDIPIGVIEVILSSPDSLEKRVFAWSNLMEKEKVLPELQSWVRSWSYKVLDSAPVDMGPLFQ